VQARIQKESAFVCWVPYELKKQLQTVSKVKSKYWQRTHTYGIRIREGCISDKSVNHRISTKFVRQGTDAAFTPGFRDKEDRVKTVIDESVLSAKIPHRDIIIVDESA
jgi:hypothetical protein